MKWKIWYSDGSTYSSEDGPIELAPKTRVQVIAQEHPDHGRQLVTNQKGYYWWSDDKDGWYGGDSWGFYQYMASPGYKLALFGQSIPTKEFLSIYRQANKDPFLPPRSAADEDEQSLLSEVDSWDT